jgi:hypothetical protein
MTISVNVSMETILKAGNYTLLSNYELIHNKTDKILVIDVLFLKYILYICEIHLNTSPSAFL